MKLDILGDVSPPADARQFDVIAFALRIGLGLVFLTGGLWKLSRALDPSRSETLVSKYMASDGYINTFFADYLFGSNILTPWMFLTALSAFELIAGLALLAGLFVRFFSFVFAFLLWSFVVALPITTTPGIALDVPGFFSPALLIQIRDVGLSGMFFVLLCIGSGTKSLDHLWLGRGQPDTVPDWQDLGLLLRLSVAVVFLTGGFFFGLDHIKSWIAQPFILVVVGALIASGHLTRLAAGAGLAIVVWYSISKLGIDKSLLDNVNAIKRELAFLAACGVLTFFGGGTRFQILALTKSPLAMLAGRRVVPERV